MNWIKLYYFGKVSSKKNAHRAVLNPRTRKMMVIRDASARSNEADIIAEFSKQFSERRIEWKLPLSVRMEIWEESRRRHDLDNQASTILDALKESVIPDDNVNVIQELIVCYMGVDAEHPRVAVTVKELEKSPHLEDSSLNLRTTSN